MSAARFAGQRVLVTGSSGYFGRELAQAFAQEGAALILLDRDAPSAALLAALQAASAQAAEPPRVLQADLAQVEQLPALIDALADDALPTVLVNNAGIFPFADILDAPLELCRTIFEVNVLAPFVLARSLARRWIDAGIAGRIVNVSSAAAEVARSNGALYGPSKAALEQLTRILAVELAPQGIRVNVARPGLANDPLNAQIPPDHLARLSAALPLGRGIAPGEFARAVLFLCSEESSYMTGAVLNVDGGGGINRRAPAR